MNNERNEGPVKSNLDALKEAELKIEAKVAAAEDTLSDAADAAEETAEDVADDVRSRFARVETRVRAASERVRQNVQNLRDDAGERLKTYPFASVGVAFVAGLALASLFRRRA